MILSFYSLILSLMKGKETKTSFDQPKVQSNLFALQQLLEASGKRATAKGPQLYFRQAHKLKSKNTQVKLVQGNHVPSVTQKYGIDLKGIRHHPS